MSINKYELNTENINACVDWAKISGYDFELILSNYTAKIECKQNEALNIQFIKEEKPFYFFAMYKELKKQYKTFYTTLQISTQLYETFRILRKLYTSLRNFTKFYKTRQNYTTLYITLHLFTQLYNSCTQLYNTLHNFRKTLQK
jgi:hypothetical protein